MPWPTGIVEGEDGHDDGDEQSEEGDPASSMMIGIFEYLPASIGCVLMNVDCPCFGIDMAPVFMPALDYDERLGRDVGASDLRSFSSTADKSRMRRDRLVLLYVGRRFGAQDLLVPTGTG